MVELPAFSHEVLVYMDIDINIKYIYIYIYIKLKFLKLSQFSTLVQYLNKIIIFNTNLTRSETLSH